MIKETENMFDLFDTTGFSHTVLQEPDTAHLVVNENKVLGSHLVPGFHVDIHEKEDGIDAEMTLDNGIVIKKPVHICFGVLPEKGIQKINMKVKIGKNSGIFIYAHCTFPFATDVQHIMNADIHIGENSVYTYFERHTHSEEGGIRVYPTARVELDRGAKFRTVFELLKGKVGLIDIDYETTCRDYSVMEMTAKIHGRGDDKIKIREVGRLIGEKSVGVLTSRVAARDNARAEVYNELTATAPYARGHVDCKEIIQGNGSARAVPIVDVKHPKAHVTHEAAIGSVDTKELETLMSRGLDEDEASDLIIAGLLS
jgi:uncharacterized protein